jgi:hypothetical protein
MVNYKKHINKKMYKSFIEKISKNYKRILIGLKQENEETKEAFNKLVLAVKEKRTLTKKEKKEIGDQLKDLLKLSGFTFAIILPGGSIYFILSKIPQLKKHLIPSSFLEKIDEKEPLNN